MAKFYSGVSGYVKMALQVAETSTDISANTSAISWALIAWFTGSSSSQWYSNSSHDISVVINGQTVFSRGSAEKILVSIGTDHASESNPVTIASGSLTVAHNSDGTKNISVSFSMAYKWASYAWSASGTLGLTTIARASQPSCITFPNTTENVGKLGDTIIIHANRASTSFTHTARYKWGSKEGTIATGIGDNVQWTIPVSLATEIPKDTSGWGNILLDTYQNGNLIGTKSVAFMASVPSIPPTISYVKTEEAATIPKNITEYVQAWSKFKITNTASGQYGASIQKYEVSVDGKTYTGNGITTNAIQISGNVPITVTATDSRGQKTTVTVYATVQPYALPKITGVSSYRCNASGELDASGAYICIHATGELSAINNQNGRACTAYWRKTTESPWKSKAIAMNSYKLDASVIVDAATDASYNICVRLQDSFKLIDHYGSDVMSAFAFIDILTASETDDTKKGMAIGKAAEVEGAVDIGWNLIARKGFTWQGMPLTYFTPTVNVSGEYYGKYGCYAKIGHVAVVVLMVQIKSVSGSAPSEIQITLPDALKAVDHWLQPSHPILGQWGGTFLGVFRQNQNSAILTVLPASSVTAGTYLANGCYTFLVQ